MAFVQVVRRSMRPEEYTDLRAGWLNEIGGVDKVHVLVKGKVVETGGRDFLERLESFAEYREEE